MEFKIVFHLDMYRFIIPNEYKDMKSEEKIQALNLHYVGITRAKAACYIMIGSNRYSQRKNHIVEAEESPFLHITGLNELTRNVKW